MVDRRDRVEQVRVQTCLGGHVRQGAHVLGKTATSVAKTGVEEGTTDTTIITHAVRDLLYVCTQPLAYLRYLIDEADLGGQEGVRGVFDHLSCVEISDHDRRTERRVEAGHRLRGHAVGGADDPPARPKKILYGRAPPQEPGARPHLHPPFR